VFEPDITFIQKNRPPKDLYKKISFSFTFLLATLIYHFSVV
jgi:hypothetical protein